MSVPVTFSFAGFAADYCWVSPQLYATDLIARLSGTVPSTAYNIGIDTPAAGDRDKPWFRLNSDGTPDGWYYFSGDWLKPHPVPPSSPYNIIWDGDLTTLAAFDGGDANPLGPSSGPMWVRNTNFGDESGTKCFRVPIGAGTNPTPYDGGSPTVIAQGDNGGVERVNLNSGQLAQHSHIVANSIFGTTGADTLTGANYINNASGGGGSQDYKLQGSGDFPNVGLTSPVGSGLSHENLPPYRGVIFARRSSRIFYKAS